MKKIKILCFLGFHYWKTIKSKMIGQYIEEVQLKCNRCNKEKEDIIVNF